MPFEFILCLPGILCPLSASLQLSPYFMALGNPFLSLLLCECDLFIAVVRFYIFVNWCSVLLCLAYLLNIIYVIKSSTISFYFYCTPFVGCVSFIHLTWERTHVAFTSRLVWTMLNEFGECLRGFLSSRPWNHGGVRWWSAATWTTGDSLIEHVRLLKCKHKLIQTKKGERRVTSPNSAPTQQQRCNWAEGTSIFLDPPIMSEVTYNTHGWRVGRGSCPQGNRQNPGAISHRSAAVSLTYWFLLYLDMQGSGTTKLYGNSTLNFWKNQYAVL